VMRCSTLYAGDAVVGCTPDAARNGLPQAPQNLAEGSLVKPQFAHGAGSGAPHCAQERLVVAFSALQLGERILVNPAARANSSITLE
jgi:hypothetical protein